MLSFDVMKMPCRNQERQLGQLLNPASSPEADGSGFVP